MRKDSDRDFRRGLNFKVRLIQNTYPHHDKKSATFHDLRVGQRSMSDWPVEKVKVFEDEFTGWKPVPLEPLLLAGLDREKERFCRGLNGAGEFP